MNVTKTMLERKEVYKMMQVRKMLLYNFSRGSWYDANQILPYNWKDLSYNYYFFHIVNNLYN